MTDAVKLLTEADLELMDAQTSEEREAFLRERGLIAPEPDPLLIEAREICARDAESEHPADLECAAEYRAGKRDWTIAFRVALAALKRGMEMRPPLTREMVREAVRAHCPIGGSWTVSQISDLHAALTKEQS